MEQNQWYSPLVGMRRVIRTTMAELRLGDEILDAQAIVDATYTGTIVVNPVNPERGIWGIAWHKWRDSAPFYDSLYPDPTLVWRFMRPEEIAAEDADDDDTPPPARGWVQPTVTVTPGYTLWEVTVDQTWRGGKQYTGLLLARIQPDDDEIIIFAEDEWGVEFDPIMDDVAVEAINVAHISFVAED